MRMRTSVRVRKVATNLSLPKALAGRARAWKINMSEVLERALEIEVEQREAEAWLAESRQAIASYNRRVAKMGTFSDGWRKF